MYLSVFTHTAPLRVRSADRDFLTWFTPWFSVVFPHWDFLFGFLQIFLQSVLSGYFNVGISTTTFLQVGILVLSVYNVPDAS
jgi:hypothetical protein